MAPNAGNTSYILDETYNLLKTRYIRQIENLTITDVCLGVYMTAVRLSDNSYGVASTLLDTDHHCVKKNRDFDDFTPIRIRGHKVTYLFEIEKSSNIIRTLKIAVLNAISSTLLSGNGYKIIEDSDPIDLIDLKPKKTITIVGAFHSYIQKIAATDNKLYVLELNENALIDECQKYYVPAADYGKVLPGSDIVIITGLTLVNNTIDGLLTSISPQSQVVVTGPSSSIIPDVLFQNKVTIIGATRIQNPDLLFPLVSEGGTGYHLFKYCAQKICILSD